jgi:hypothetical protein
MLIYAIKIAFVTNFFRTSFSPRVFVILRKIFQKKIELMTVLFYGSLRFYGLHKFAAFKLCH